ncbi:MAG: phosphatase PAP2 family protein [Lachnospiraceae bacterium]|nr:phosphatase PAP2 family protein [Lachnospiraceae bacterium]
MSRRRKRKKVLTADTAQVPARVSFAVPAAFAIASLLFTLLVKTVDTAAAGPSGTRIGLSHLNVFFHELTGEHLFLYRLSQITGALALLVAFLFAAYGTAQLVKSRSLFRVDPRILALGMVYMATVLLYLFFEIVVINYRPVLMPGDSVPEPSYPSSHTVLACVVFLTAAPACKNIFRRMRLRTAPVKYAGVLFAVLTVFFRLFSGVHWLTDIIGGILFSAFLVSLYSRILYFVSGKKNIASNVRFR